jgi:proline dehydrogenase
VSVVASADVDATALLAGLPPGTDLCVPVRHVAAAAELARAAARREVTLTLRVATWSGTAATVLAEVRRRVPATGVQLDARLPGAEAACAVLDGRVQLVTGALPAPAGAVPPADGDLAAVRCLELLLAGPARVSVDAADPQLARLAAERGAWHTRSGVTPSPRPSESWELLMPYDRPTPPLAAPVRLLVPVAGGPQ